MARTIPAKFINQGLQRKPEAIFASNVIKYLKQLYGDRFWETAVRGGLGQRSGIPDRLCCIDGRMIAIEFKNPDGTGRLGPKQKLELEKLAAAGAVALVISSWDDAKKIVDQFTPTQLLMRKG